MLEAQQKPVYRCGDYRIDTLRRGIFMNGERLAVTARAFDVLVELIERAGEVVTKDDLLSAVWPDTVVEENNLTQQISALRKLFNDRAGDHRFIATVPGRGYCFAAPVTVETVCQPERSEVLVAGSTVSSITIDLSDPAGTLGFGPFSLDPSALRGAMIAAVYIFVIVAAALVFNGRGGDQSARLRSVGVMTFKSLGTDDDRYGVGIRDTLRAKLGSLEDVTVRADLIESPMSDTLAAGRQINADLVLSGSVQRENGRIRVAVEMVDVHAERVVWGGTFDEDAANVFELQDSIAEAVIRSLRSAKGEHWTSENRIDPLHAVFQHTAA